MRKRKKKSKDREAISGKASKTSKIKSSAGSGIDFEEEDAD